MRSRETEATELPTPELNMRGLLSNLSHPLRAQVSHLCFLVGILFLVRLLEVLQW